MCGDTRIPRDMCMCGKHNTRGNTHPYDTGAKLGGSLLRMKHADRVQWYSIKSQYRLSIVTGSTNSYISQNQRLTLLSSVVASLD